MASTRTIRETVKARSQSDDRFRYALFSHTVEVMLADDMATAKSVLRDYIDATLGFAELSAESGLTVRHLKGMFQPSGNPRADEKVQGDRHIAAPPGDTTGSEHGGVRAGRLQLVTNMLPISHEAR